MKTRLARRAARRRSSTESTRYSSDRGRLPRLLLRSSLTSPTRTLLLSSLLVVIGGLAIPNLRVETTTDSVLNRNGSEWSFYQRSQRLFGGDELLVVALEGKGAYDIELLRHLSQLSRSLESLPGVRRVDSLSTVPIVAVNGEGTLVLDPALQRFPWRTKNASQVLRDRLALDRVAPRSLISTTGTVVAANILLDNDADSQYPALLSGIRDGVGERNAWISGVPVFRYEATATTQRELVFFVPITILVIALVLFLLFRSIRAVLIPLVVSGAGTTVLLGWMGVLGTPLTLTTAVLPSIVLALGCAYVMHLLTAAEGISGPEELLRVLEPLALPVALSGLTTALGFVAISLVRIDAIRFVGGYGAIGVVSVLLFSLTAAPALLALWPLPPSTQRTRSIIRDRLAPLVVRVVARRSGLVIACWGVILVVLAVGLPRISVETDATQWFPRGHAIRDDYDAIRQSLSGISPVNVIIQSEGQLPVTEPAALQAIDRLSAFLEDLPGVGKALSIADPLRQLHGGFLVDATQPLPLDTRLAEQYLLLLESAEQIRDLVTGDRQAANVILRVNNNSSSHLLQIAEKAEAWWEQNAPGGFSARATGIMFEFARAQDEIARGQILGLGFATVAIALILYGIFRDWILASIALLPNAVPVAMIFGVMGLAGIPVDAGTVLVGSFALGIAVDDTIHLTTGFFEESEQGIGGPEALTRSVSRVLPPLLYTTVVIAVGFAAFTLSEFSFTKSIGALTGSVMVLCLVADLTLLPALLLNANVSKRLFTDSARVRAL